MKIFDLPKSTDVNKNVPKNAFDQYSNTNQKKLFKDQIQRITWTHKLSEQTVNLESKNIKEIQIFKVELKSKIKIAKILNTIDKAIPYHIAFWVQYNEYAYLSTSCKHNHPINDNMSVIDWVFSSDWFKARDSEYEFVLKKSLDDIHKDLCIQLTGRLELLTESMDNILLNQKSIDELKKDIIKLKAGISKTKQFNEKVKLNILLKEKNKQLAKFLLKP